MQLLQTNQILICITDKASEDACPTLRPNQREWKYIDDHQKG